MSALLSSQRNPILGDNNFASTSSGLTTPAAARFKHVPRIPPTQLKHLQSEGPAGSLPTPMSMQAGRSHPAAYASTEASELEYEEEISESSRAAQARAEREAMETRRTQERDHSTGLIMKLDEVRARLNGSQRTATSERSVTASSDTEDAGRSMPRFSFKDLRDKGAALARIAGQEMPRGGRLSDGNGSEANSRLHRSNSSRSSTPTRLRESTGESTVSEVHRTSEDMEIDHPTTHLNISKPLSARDVNPAEDGQSSGRSSPGLSLHPSDFSEEEKPPRKSLLDLDRLNWRGMQDREAEQERPRRSPSPKFTGPSPPLFPRHRFENRDSATPVPQINGHSYKPSSGSEVSLTLSLSSLLDGVPGEAGPSTSSPIKQRAKHSLRSDEQRLKRLRESGALRKTPSPVLSWRSGSEEKEAKSWRSEEVDKTQTPPRPASIRKGAFEVPPTPPDLPHLPSASNTSHEQVSESDNGHVSDSSNGPQTFVSQAKAHLRAHREEPSDDLSASLEGPLIRPSTKRDPDENDRDWEKVTPLNSIISVPEDSSVHTSPSRREQQSRIKNVSRGIDAPLKSSPSKFRKTSTSPEQIRRSLVQASPRAGQANGIGMPSPTHSEVDGMPSPPGSELLPKEEHRESMERSDSTIRLLAAPRLPSPVSQDISRQPSSELSRSLSQALHESAHAPEEPIDAEPQPTSILQDLTNSAVTFPAAQQAQQLQQPNLARDPSDLLVIEKARLIQIVHNAEHLQSLVHAYEEQERSRQAELVNQSMTAINTAQNARVAVLPVQGVEGKTVKVAAAEVGKRTQSRPRGRLWSIFRGIMLLLGLLLLLTTTFEYGRHQSSRLTALRPHPPLLASLTAMYDPSPLSRTWRYMELRRPEVGFWPVEWAAWAIEAVEFFLVGPYY